MVWGSKRVAAGLDARVAKTCLDRSVGEWSAKTREDACFVLACFAFSGLDPCTHNPEVVGSSPASATIKTTVFERKAVVFLYF